MIGRPRQRTSGSSEKSSGPIRKDQIIRIHVILAAIGIGDELYRHILAGEPFCTDTCKKLDVEKASLLVGRLEDIGVESGRWVRYNRMKYEDLGQRPGMASPSKLRKIEAMWNDVSYQKTEKLRTSALRRLLFRLYEISDLRFLADWQANKIINTLARMGKGKAFEADLDRFYPLDRTKRYRPEGGAT